MIKTRLRPNIPSLRIIFDRRSMATIRSSLPHEDRTAFEPRESRLEPVILSHIREVNDSIRLLRLNAADPNHTIKVGGIQTASVTGISTDHLASKVLSGSMVGYIHTWPAKGWWLYNHLYSESG